MYDAPGKQKTVAEIRRELVKAPVVINVSGCMESHKEALAASLLSGYGRMLYLCPDDRAAAEACSDFRCFTGSCWLYPAKDLLFYSSDVHGGYIINARGQKKKY